MSNVVLDKLSLLEVSMKPIKISLQESTNDNEMKPQWNLNWWTKNNARHCKYQRKIALHFLTTTFLTLYSAYNNFKYAFVF